MKLKNNHWPDEDGDVAVMEVTEEKTVASKQIVLHNDDYNTFEHVIDCLMKYCKHSSEQAEQCATIVHHNGRCSVKNGDLKKLVPICEALLENGLTAEIQ